jgi:delta-1-pyrroline-5-carboxylate synthetase
LTLQELLQLNIIPIINTNDAVSPPQQKEYDNSSGGLLNITDNDSLAARIAVEMGSDLVLISIQILSVKTYLDSWTIF